MTTYEAVVVSQTVGVSAEVAYAFANRLAEVSQESFDADVAHVRRDLAALKELLEQQAS